MFVLYPTQFHVPILVRLAQNIWPSSMDRQTNKQTDILSYMLNFHTLQDDCARFLSYHVYVHLAISKYPGVKPLLRFASSGRSVVGVGLSKVEGK